MVLGKKKKRRRQKKRKKEKKRHSFRLLRFEVQVQKPVGLN